MRRSAEPMPERLAAAVADGVSIDWVSAETAADATNVELVRQLRVIASLRHRPSAASATPRVWLSRLLAMAFGVGVSVAAAKVLLAVAGLAAMLATARMPPAAVPFALNTTIFGIGGLLLVGGGGRDRRLQLLGGFYLTIASAFVDPFWPQSAGTSGVLVDVLSFSKPESFAVLGVWLFAWAFPNEPTGRRTRQLAAGAIGVVAVCVSVLFVTSFVIEAHYASAIDSPRFLELFAAFDRRSLSAKYWPVLFALALPALPFLVAKSRNVGPDGQQRVRLFLMALAAGFLPFVAAVVATPFLPALRDPETRQRVGLVLYLALGSIVPMTAYAVAVNRVMDWQLVVKTALRYALARYAIRAAIVGPLTYLAIDVFLHRGLTILQYLDAERPTGPLALSGLGLAALTFRPHLIRAVDRWFLREPLDPSQALARLEHRFRASEHLRDISTALAEELAHALPARSATVWLAAEGGRALVALEGDAPPIASDSVLLELMRSTRREIQIDPDSTLVRLLPDADQDWLDRTGARLLSPLIRSSGTLAGLVAIGSGPDALPYTDRHTELVTAMCSQAALQLENRWLRHAQADMGRPVLATSSGVEWRDEPAVWCPSCSRTWSPDTSRCRCGVATKPAILPMFVNGKYRLQRVLGAGGTGVVYLATDLALERQVALKTLPPVRREYAPRLLREARAMAAVRHPNLATIYGLEEWHDTPLLVVEFLEGGTLLEWLARGPLSFDEGLDLGIMLADALERVHGSGVLHRDIKPSNIGYTADGVPKLLDFGLAAMLDSSRGPEGSAPEAAFAPAELIGRLQTSSASSTLTVTHHIVGTPLYLSPEALAGSPPSESFDLWSLNMVLYEAMAGRHPFGGRVVAAVVEAIQAGDVPDVRDLRPECPPYIAAYLTDALSRVAVRRPADAGAIRTELRGLRARLELKR